MEPFDIDGLTPAEVVEKISATIMTLTAMAIKFTRTRTQEDIEEAYQQGYADGHKDGMTEAVTTITE